MNKLDVRLIFMAMPIVLLGCLTLVFIYVVLEAFRVATFLAVIMVTPILIRWEKQHPEYSRVKIKTAAASLFRAFVEDWDGLSNLLLGNLFK